MEGYFNIRVCNSSAGIGVYGAAKVSKKRVMLLFVSL